MTPTINNFLVDSLRTGKGSVVSALFGLGQGPFVDLDLVEVDPDVLSSRPPVVTRQSVWAWIHQAPLADAVEVCWKVRLARELEGLPTYERSELLLKSYTQAIESALGSSQSVPLLASWRFFMHYATQEENRFDRALMLRVLGNRFCRFGDSGAAVLLALKDDGAISRPDFRKWLSDDPKTLEKALGAGFPALTEALLATAYDSGDRIAWTAVLDRALLSALVSEAPVGPLLLCCEKFRDFGIDFPPAPEPLMAAIAQASSRLVGADRAALNELALTRGLGNSGVSSPTQRPRF